MAPHSSTVAWKIPGMEELAGYSLWGHKESDVTERRALSSMSGVLVKGGNLDTEVDGSEGKPERARHL